MQLVPPPGARRAAAPEGAPPQDFVRTVADALAHLHDAARLQTHPLAARLVPSGRSPHTFGRSLEHALRGAVDELRPAGRRSPDHARRIHRLLFLRYIDGLEPSVVWKQLGIGKSEYYREHGRGVHAVASVLWQRRVSDDQRVLRSVVVNMPTAHHRLPSMLTSFVGRGGELNELHALLQLKRLVTVTGPPGAGKTRLALQLASEGRPGLPENVVFVGLAPVAEPNLVWPAVAQALGLQGRPRRNALDEVIHELSDREILLTLDNFEHVVAAGPELSALLGSCPRLRVLVTSRELLHMSGEDAYALSPLGQSDSVQLFVERARSVRADFHMTDENVVAVHAICARVDGLPLAIELAAGRVRLFGPSALLARLERRLPLLSGGPRDHSPRQQALRATIAWSYDLLNAAEQALFQNLAVCVGGCSLEAIAALCEVDVLDDITSLVEKSLLNQDAGINGEPRFWMLETLREYALEHLEHNSLNMKVRRAHALYFRDFAEHAEVDYFGPGEAACLDLLEQDYANLRSAIMWSLEAHELEVGLALAGALWRFFFHRDHLSDGRNVLRRLLSAAEAAEVAVTPATMAKARFAVASLAVWQGDSPAGRDDAASSVALYRALGDKRREGYALHTLVHTAAEPTVVRDLYVESVGCLRQVSDIRALAWSLQCLANAMVAMGELEEARVVLTEGIAAARQAGSPQTLSGMVTGLGNLAARQGDHARAYELYVEGFELRRQQNDRAVTDQLNVLGRAALDMNDLDRASTHFAESLELCQQQGIKWGAAIALDGSAEVEMQRDNLLQALTLFAAADEVLDALQERRSSDDQARHERMLESLTATLGETLFQQVSAAGRAMTRDEAIASALLSASSN
jgi:predicted ATPase